MKYYKNRERELAAKNAVIALQELLPFVDDITVEAQVDCDIQEADVMLVDIIEEIKRFY